MKKSFLGAAVLFCGTAAAMPREKPRYKDDSLSIEERVDGLMRRMTLREKVLQLQNNSTRYPDAISNVHKGESTGSVHEMSKSAKEAALFFYKLQRYLTTETRLGIPALVCTECIEGVLQNDCTIFLQAIAQGCTFNPDLVERMGKAIGREARTIGVRLLLRSVLDIARELRWGRVEETFGEDPFLIGEMGTRYVRGAQSEGVGAMPKHFVAHGTPTGGLNCASVSGGVRELRNLYAYPLAKVVKNVGPVAAMGRYKSNAVLDPNSGFGSVGDYGWVDANHHKCVTLFDGLKGALAGSVTVEQFDGCDWLCQDIGGIADAVRLAEQSDLAIVAVGTLSLWLGRGVKAGKSASDEGFDLSSLELPDKQLDFLKAVKATGKPMIVAFISGKPLVLTWAKENADAVLVQFYGGEQQDNAMADVLLGKVILSGRLNVSFPRSTGNTPCFYNHRSGEHLRLGRILRRA